ncbi:dual OB domain-containing protein [Actinokineospora fastidiosa]|uniref:Dual OB-containing domain-containing protein n=1 Tax=Actinokineospora fastidiosa TaxID=1816 RepID=A0A918GMA2_9PSEU|nr:hypothetical protein [Actinokineospora fastidiosa]GGS46264.1 hypothetical protein GCM10010171_46840 [Actinokineospora fastidiosa]
MAVTKRIVCLANSRKHQGRCVAGIDLDSGRWIRPISKRPGHELSASERQYEDGSEPAPLDVLDVPLIGHRPAEVHRENWLLDSGKRWRRAGRMTWDDLLRFTRDAGPLWINGHKTSVDPR